MDVTCQRCKAEYEFDETLLGEKGTTVKCSSCGHVFRVLPPEHDKARTQLRLRYAKDGTVQSIGSLRELQQRIRNGDVSLDDELGRDGFPFRRLRELPELKNFFSRSPEKTTVKPAATAPTLAALSNPDLTPSVPVRIDSVLGSAPTALRQPYAGIARSSSEPEVAENLDEPTVVAPIPEEIRPRAVKDEPKRTMLGVGPAVSEPGAMEPAPQRPPASATLGPAAAMARGRGEPEPAMRTAAPAEREAPPKVNPAGTLVGAPAPVLTGGGERSPAQPRAFDPAARSRNEPPVAPRWEPPAAQRSEPPVASPQWAPPAAAALAAPPTAPAALPPAASARGPALNPGAPPAARSGGPGAPAAAVRLYLDDDEMPPARATSSSGSKLWLLPLVALLAAGGYFGFNAWQDAQEDAARGATAPESVATDAGLVSSASDAAAMLAAEPAAQGSSAQAAGAGAPEAAAADLADAEEDEEGAPAGAKGPAAPAEASKGAGEPREAKESREAKDNSDDKAPKGEERARRAASPAEPKDYAEWVSRGDQLVARSDHEGAAKAYEAALALRPTGSEANSGLGFALLSHGRARDALPHFDRAASSGYAEANVGLGDAYRKLGQPSSALEAYRTYLERLPTGARASYVKGWIGKLEKGDSEGKEPAAAAPVESAYRPAGELVEPSPAPAAPTAPAAPAGESAQ